MLDDIDRDDPQEERPQRSGNNRFVALAGILGAILLLALIAVAIYALVILPAQQAPPVEPDAELSIQQTATALALAAQATDTTAPTSTTSPTPAPSDTPTATPVTPIFTAAAGGATATVNALLTEAAQALTATPGGPTATPSSTPSSLPDTGFADEFGFPGLIAAAGLLLVVIVFARRLRGETY